MNRLTIRRYRSLMKIQTTNDAIEGDENDTEVDEDPDYKNIISRGDDTEDDGDNNYYGGYGDETIQNTILLLYFNSAFNGNKMVQNTMVILTIRMTADYFNETIQKLMKIQTIRRYRS
ncbi:Hypothetical predicted protein [Mytilus galloprovincialis]|uniref:Uncharacterized protein n=1 Tax=Mytilus galloprovincialis TaxID=29158 RepID=A0A8B6E5T7_MYTGA|nr:Hypothetical predicted protein [Mytilus galloprovincialis]